MEPTMRDAGQIEQQLRGGLNEPLLFDPARSGVDWLALAPRRSGESALRPAALPRPAHERRCAGPGNGLGRSHEHPDPDLLRFSRRPR